MKRKQLRVGGMVPGTPSVQIELGIRTYQVHTYSHTRALTPTHTWTTNEGTPGKSGKTLGTYLARACPHGPGLPWMWQAGPFLGIYPIPDGLLAPSSYRVLP